MYVYSSAALWGGGGVVHEKNKTRDKTRQDKTRQDETGQDKTQPDQHTARIKIPLLHSPVQVGDMYVLRGKSCCERTKRTKLGK